MYGELDITFFDHTGTIDIERKEKQGSFKQTRYNEFAKNVCEFLLQQDWYSADNSGNITWGSKKISTVLEVSNSTSEHKIHHKISQSDSFL